MKKIISAFLLFAILTLMLGLTSCSGNTDYDRPKPSDFVNERFIYRMDNGTLKRYDLVNKTISVACPDPLCEHGDDCPVTNISGYTVTDKYVFLERGFGGKRSMMLSVYDIEKNTIEPLVEGTQIGYVYMAEEYAFFSIGRFVYDDNGDVNKEVYDVYRYDTLNKKLEKISDEPIAGQLKIVKYENGKIYWQEVGVNIAFDYYITDFDYKNREEWGTLKYKEYCNIKNSVNGYSLEMDFVRPDNSLGSGRRVYFVNSETNDIKVLAECVYGARWADLDNRNAIIYQPAKFVPEEINGAEKLVLKIENKIVHVNAYDFSDVKEWSLPEGISVDVNGMTGEQYNVGNYIGFGATFSYRENEKEYYSHGLFIINTKSGESFAINDESTRREVKPSEEVVP